MYTFDTFLFLLFKGFSVTVGILLALLLLLLFIFALRFILGFLCDLFEFLTDFFS